MLPVTRQLALLIGLAASIALGIWLVQWSLAPNLTPIYGQLSPSETTEIIRFLEEEKVEYSFDNRSGLISVPAEEVYQARLKLAGQGLPSGDGNGFDMLYKEQEIGLSSFMEKARYDRALEQELSRSIASLDSVKAARVHLALPKESAFVRKKNKPAASVLLNLYRGRELTDTQLAGVVHMVASSVPGLEASQVSVVDNQGRLLSSKGDKNDFTGSKEQVDYTHRLEQDYAERIVSILTPILGVGAVKAQVAADVDFTVIEKTSEIYSPESSLRSEQLEEELSETSSKGGAPGTLANQPPVETQVSETAPGGEASNNAGRTSKRQIRNYELDKTISHIREAPGSLKKLSVAVVVDYESQTNEEGLLERVALSEERIAQITTLVKDTVGFSEKRGDSVNVINASFVVEPELEPLPEPSLMEQPWIWQIAKLVLGALAFLLVVFTVLRPLMQVSAVAPSSGTPALPEGAANQAGYQGGIAGADQGLAEDQVTLGYGQQGLPPGQSGYQQQLSMARSMVENEPERVAHVVKGWVASDD